MSRPSTTTRAMMGALRRRGVGVGACHIGGASFIGAPG
jgi:hypothetical protein